MSKSIIVARILGGIGNQLFIYAAARRLSLVNKCELVLDDVSGFKRDFVFKRTFQLHHFNISGRFATPKERLEPFPNLHRKFLILANQSKPFDDRKYICQEGRDFDRRLLNLNPVGKIHIEGYWQSEGYFKDVEDTIRHDLTIKAPNDTINLDLHDKIQRVTAVAIHVRFFESTRPDKITNDYYQRAFEMIESRIPDAHYFIFSDDPTMVLSTIPVPKERFTLVSHNCNDENAYADLWLMSKCKHFIIANSTFSWWGAWLSNTPDKIVIAPIIPNTTGDMGWGFRGLLPDEWHQL